MIDCYFKKLPTVIFTVIEHYLESKEYHQFLSSSRSLFQDIKPRIFKISEDEIKVEELEKRDQRIINEYLGLRFDQFSVMRRQFEEDGRLHLLRLLIRDTPENILINNALFFANIYQIRVRYSGRISADFDFSIFNNINTVRLDRFHGVKKITKGLENIRHLILFDFQDLISIDCQWVGLDSLEVIGCQRLTSIQSLQGIREMKVNRCYELILDLSSTSNSLRRLTIEEISSSIGLNMIPCQSLQYLNISGFMKASDDFDNFHVLINIPHLEFAGTPALSNIEFPLFYGKRLSLRYFRLSAWTMGIRLENLLWLSLDHGYGCVHLPTFPNVKILFLKNMNDLQEIHSNCLPKCLRMIIMTCSQLHSIHRLVNLKSIDIRFCGKFQEFIGFTEFDNLTTVRLQQVPSFSKMKCLRYVPEISLIKCDGSPLDFDGFDQSPSLSNEQRRNVLLEECIFPVDLNGLGNIGRLEIRSGSGLIDGQGIYDIDHLILKDVAELTSFKSFRNIKRMDVYQAYKLSSFDGLQNVPIVLFSYHPRHYFTVFPFVKIKPFFDLHEISPEGLRGCDQVSFHEGFFIAKEAQKYVNDRSSTLFAEIFETIKEFYVLSFRQTAADSSVFIRWQNRVEERTRLW